MEFKDVMTKARLMCDSMNTCCDMCPLKMTHNDYSFCAFTNTYDKTIRTSPEDIERKIETWYRVNKGSDDDDFKDGDDMDRIACSDDESVKFNITKDECCELILAISKYERALKGIDDITSMDTILYAQQNLIEELGDVKLMIDQLTRILDCRDQVEEAMKYSIDSQLKRMEREKNLGNKR